MTVSDDLVDRGLSAGDLVKVAGGPIGAKGGGRPQMAQGIGTRREGLAEAETAVRRSIAQRLGAGADGVLAPDAATRRGRGLAACTALDVGTEFAKALVFEIDDEGLGTVRGVGRKRQGLSHMQSGTVADIAAVVDNCTVALQEAEEMAGFAGARSSSASPGSWSRATTTHSQERKRPDQASASPSSRS